MLAVLEKDWKEARRIQHGLRRDAAATAGRVAEEARELAGEVPF